MAKKYLGMEELVSSTFFVNNSISDFVGEGENREYQTNHNKRVYVCRSTLMTDPHTMLQNAAYPEVYHSKADIPNHIGLAFRQAYCNTASQLFTNERIAEAVKTGNACEVYECIAAIELQDLDNHWDLWRGFSGCILAQMAEVMPLVKYNAGACCLDIGIAPYELIQAPLAFLQNKAGEVFPRNISEIHQSFCDVMRMLYPTNEVIRIASKKADAVKVYEIASKMYDEGKRPADVEFPGFAACVLMQIMGKLEVKIPVVTEAAA